MAEPQAPASAPASRDQFHVAIICALEQEANAMLLLFDRFWDEDGDPYGRAPGDDNTYHYGRIGRADVVLVTLPSKGSASAASASAGLRSSFRSLVLALLVGICGGVPTIEDNDAFLGDVVISSFIVQYDYGKQYPSRYTIGEVREDTLGRAGRQIRSILAHVKTDRGREMVVEKAAAHLGRLQEAAKGRRSRRRRPSYTFPGVENDCLFTAGYMHRHHHGCQECIGDAACAVATQTSCVEIGCDLRAQRVERPAREADPRWGCQPEVFVGRIGSGNTVMKSGLDRDRLAGEHGLAAFEMEGAGAWDEVPCLVVKGIADYADSHKDDVWANYAAATAASVARALVERYVIVVDGSGGIESLVQEQYFVFVGGETRGPGQRAPGVGAPGSKGSLPSSSRSISNNTIGAGAHINQGDIFNGSLGRQRDWSGPQ